MNVLDIGKKLADFEKRLNEQVVIKDRRNTLFPVESQTGLELRRIREQLATPIGAIVTYYGNHDRLPYGWKSLDSDLRLNKEDYKNLYLTIKDNSNVDEEQDYFTISSVTNSIIRVI